MLRSRGMVRSRAQPLNDYPVRRRWMVHVPFPFQTCKCSRTISFPALAHHGHASITLPSSSAPATNIIAAVSSTHFSTSASAAASSSSSSPDVSQNSLLHEVRSILDADPHQPKQALQEPFPTLPAALLQRKLRVSELEILELQFREADHSTSQEQPQQLLQWQRAVLLRCYAHLQPLTEEEEARILLASLRLVCEVYSSRTNATHYASMQPPIHCELFTLQFVQDLLMRCVTLASKILQTRPASATSSSKTSAMQRTHYQEICVILNERIHRLHQCLFSSRASGLPSFLHKQPRNELNPYYLNLLHWFVLNRDYKSIDQLIRSKSVSIPPLTTISASSDHSAARPFAPSDENFLLHRLHNHHDSGASHELSTRHMLILLVMTAHTGDSEFAEFLLHQIEHAEFSRLASLNPEESTGLSVPPGVATSEYFNEAVLEHGLVHAYSLTLQACSSGAGSASIAQWERTNRIWLRLRQLVPSIAGKDDTGTRRSRKGKQLPESPLEDLSFPFPPACCLQLPTDSKLPSLLLSHFTASAETSSARSINWNAIFELTTALGERLPFEFCDQLAQVALRQLVKPQFQTRESPSHVAHVAVSSDFAESRLKQVRNVIERLWNYSCLHAPSPLPTPASCGDMNLLVLLIECDCALEDWVSVELYLSYFLGDAAAIDSSASLDLMGLPYDPSSMVHPVLQQCLEKLATKNGRSLEEHAFVSASITPEADEVIEKVHSTPPLLDSLLTSLLNSLALFTIRSGQTYLMESMIDAYPRWLLLLLPSARIFPFALLQRIYLAAFETQQLLVSSTRPPHTARGQLHQQQYDILVYALEFLRSAPSTEFDPVIFKEMTIGCLDSLRQLLLQFDETASRRNRAAQLNSAQSMLAEVDELLRREYEDLQQHYIQLVWPKADSTKKNADGVMFVHILLNSAFKLEQLPAYALLLLRLIRKHGKLLLAQHSAGSSTQSVQEKQRKIVVRLFKADSTDAESNISSTTTEQKEGPEDQVSSLKNTLANFLPAISTSLTTAAPFSIRTLFSHRTPPASQSPSSMTAVTDRVHHYLMEEARLAWSNDIETARESSLGPAQLQLRASRLLQRLLQHELSSTSQVHISGVGEGEGGEMEGQRGGNAAADGVDELLESIKPWAKESEDLLIVPPSVALSMSNVERQQWLQWNRERHLAANNPSASSFPSSSSSASFWFSLAQVRSLCANDHPVWRELGFSVRESSNNSTSEATTAAASFRASFSRALSQHFASERPIAWSDRQRRMSGVMGNLESRREGNFRHQPKVVRGIIGRIQTAYQTQH